jgi:hypothetical protein
MTEDCFVARVVVFDPRLMIDSSSPRRRRENTLHCSKRSRLRMGMDSSLCVIERLGRASSPYIA